MAQKWHKSPAHNCLQAIVRRDLQTRPGVISKRSGRSDQWLNMQCRKQELDSAFPRPLTQVWTFPAGSEHYQSHRKASYRR